VDVVTERLLTRLSTVGQWLLDLVYPRDCFFCGRPPAHGHICLDCLALLPLRRNASCAVCGLESLEPVAPAFLCPDCRRHLPAFEQAIIVARYDNAVRDLVHAFKYHRGLYLLEDLSLLLVSKYLDFFVAGRIAVDAVVPVPMTRAKCRQRGFNQAQLLARAFARHKQVRLPCLEKCLRRVETGVLSQTRLHRDERKENALDAYLFAGDRRAVEGKTLLLVDDVMTTGATCHACARQLRNAGAAKVYALVLARPLAF